MKDRVKEIYRKTEAFYSDVYNELARLAEENCDEQSLEQLADSAYAMREAAALLKRIQTRMHYGKDECEQRACMLAVKREQLEPIRTPYVTASAKLRTNPKLPKRKDDPEGFARLMEALRVPRELWDTGREMDPVISVSWPGMVQLCSERAAAGYPLPGGISAQNTRAMYRLHMQRRKGVLDEAD